MFLEDKSKFPLVAPAKADPFTLDSLISWLETKDPAETYNHKCTNGSCLIGQYSAAHGFPHLPYYLQTMKFDAAIPPVRKGRMTIKAHIEIYHPGFDIREATFGAALTRARSIKAGT